MTTTSRAVCLNRIGMEVGNMRRLHQTKVLCERCRDMYFAEQEAEQDAADAACAEAEDRSNKDK